MNLSRGTIHLGLILLLDLLIFNAHLASAVSPWPHQFHDGQRSNRAGEHTKLPTASFCPNFFSFYAEESMTILPSEDTFIISTSSAGALDNSVILNVDSLSSVTYSTLPDDAIIFASNNNGTSLFYTTYSIYKGGNTYMMGAYSLVTSKVFFRLKQRSHLF